MEERKRGRQYLQVNTRSPRWEGMWLYVESGGPPDREARGRVKPKSRRCMATKRDGSPCRLWAVRKSEPALCSAHSGRTHAPLDPPEEGRCTARTKADKRCPFWATRHTRREGYKGPRLCRRHGGLPEGPPPPEVTRCTATTKAGSRCRNRAMRRTCAEEHEGRPLCSVHAGVDGPEVPPPDRRCAARTREGRRCRGWAMVGAEGEEGQALCPVHAGVAGAPEGHFLSWKHGGASHRLFPEELEVLAETRRLLEEGRFTLDWELAVTRRMLWALLPGTDPWADVPLSTMLRSAGQVFRGGRVVGHLLRINKKLVKRRREVEKWERWAEEALRELDEEQALEEE